MDKKPRTAFVAFVCAFAIEMFGIPFSFYIVSWLIGKNLPEGYLWGHTLINQIGYWGMYVNYLCIFVAAILIINGWYNIYHKYWKMDGGTGAVVKTGVYKYIRHPQYTGFYLLTIGIIFEWATIPTLIMLPVIFVMYYRLAKKEETDMVEEFGDAYILYYKKFGYTYHVLPQLESVIKGKTIPFGLPLVEAMFIAPFSFRKINHLFKSGFYRNFVFPS